MDKYKTEDLISIIVPIYNAEEFLGECIESILNQSYINIEIILVNDGSTDSSLNICNKYKEMDNRIKIISKSNSGVSDARNKGISNALGKYICFADADDMLKKDFVKVLYTEIANNEVDIVFCNFEYDYNGKLIKKKPRLRAGIYNISEIKNIIIDDGTMSGILFASTWVGIYKKSIIDNNKIEFHRDIRVNEDGLFNIEYLMAIKTIKVLSEDYLYIYRQNEGSVTSNFSFENVYSQATYKIAELFKAQEVDIDLKQQLGARRVSESFWMLLNICSYSSLEGYKVTLSRLKTLLDDEELKLSYKYMDLKKINRYKYIYYILMKNKNHRSLLLLTKYIYPMFKSILSR